MNRLSRCVAGLVLLMIAGLPVEGEARCRSGCDCPIEEKTDHGCCPGCYVRETAKTQARRIRQASESDKRAPAPVTSVPSSAAPASAIPFSLPPVKKTEHQGAPSESLTPAAGSGSDTRKPSSASGKSEARPEQVQPPKPSIDLHGQDLTGTDHQGQDLQGAHLQGARLVRADLTRADLRSADLRGTDLSFARLLGADLRGAIVDATTSFYAAKLLGAKVDPEMLTIARVYGAALPGAQKAEPMVLPPASDCIAIAVSPDQSLLASIHKDDTVRLWQMATGQPIRTMGVPKKNLTTIAFSPDGTSLIASNLANGMVWVGNVATGRSVGVLEGVTTIAFMPQSKLLAAGLRSHNVVLWDSATGEVRSVLRGHRNTIQKLAFSLDGRYLASGSLDETVRVWSVSAEASIYKLKNHSHGVRELLFSADGRILCTIEGQGGRVRLWRMTSGTLLEALTDASWTCVTTKNKNLIACATKNRLVYVWDIATGSFRHVFPCQDGVVARIAFSADDRLLATQERDASVRVWDLTTGGLLQILKEPARSAGISSVSKHSVALEETFEEPAGAPDRMAFTPDGRGLIVRESNEALHLWDVRTGRLRPSLPQPDGVSAAVLSADKRILLRTAGKGAELWEVSSATRLRKLLPSAAAVTSVAFSPAGELLASARWGQGITLWDPTTGTSIDDLTKIPETIVRIAFASNERTLVGGAADGAAGLWDVSARKWLRGFDGQGSPLLQPASISEPATFASEPPQGTLSLPTVYNWGIAVSPNQPLVAQATTQGSVRLWNAVTGEQIHSLAGHDGEIQDMTFSADGRLLATCMKGNVIFLWDVATGKRMRKLSAKEWSAACRLAFSADGRLLADADGITIYLWDVGGGKMSRKIELNPSRGDSRETARIVATFSSDFAIAFHPWEPLLAAGSGDHVVRIWDAAAGVQLRSMTGHLGAITSLAFSRNGSLLATGSRDGTVRLWVPITGEPLATLARFDDGWVAFTPDGRYQTGGKSAGQFWYAIGLCHFEPDELAPYLPSVRRVAEGAPLLTSVSSSAPASK